MPSPFSNLDALAWGATASVLLLLQYRHPLSLRNIFLVYLWALCVLAPALFGYPGETTAGWTVHFLTLALVFVVSWSVGGRWPVESGRPVTAGPSGLSWSRTVDRSLSGTVVLLIALQCLIVLLSIRRYGLSGFYSGAQLVEQIQRYGLADSGGAAYQITTIALSTATNALLFFLVTRAYAVGAASVGAGPTELGPYSSRLKSNTLRLCFAWLVVFPLVQFSRSGLVFGAVAYLAARSFLKGRIVSLPMIVVATTAVVFFSAVGLARESRLGGTATVVDLFASELTPWLAYRDIKENIEFLRYQNGKTILAPMVLKLAPRGLLPEKPQNSGGYYMAMMYPDLFESGFALPPTYFGDLFLNFGQAGVMIGTAILGFLSGAADTLVRRTPQRYLGYFLILMLSYVSILRDALANSLFGLLSGLLALYLVSSLAMTLYAVGLPGRGRGVAGGWGEGPDPPGPRVPATEAPPVS